MTSSAPLVLVAGTGRSGTSTLAGVLRRLGLAVPGPEVPADDTNPRGFGEPQWVVELHDGLLAELGIQVADARPAARVRVAAPPDHDAVVGAIRSRLSPWLDRGEGVVVKDPRLLWFLPLWAEAASGLGVEPAHVTMLRPLPEVVGSRRTSYNRGLSDTHGVAGWLNLMLHTEAATRGRPRAFVRYHDLLDDWPREVAHLDRSLGLGLGEPGPEARDEVSSFVEPGLRRVRLDWSDLDLPRRLQSLAREAEDAFDGLVSAPDSSAHEARLDHVAMDYRDYYAESEAVARSSVLAARAGAVPGLVPDLPGRIAAAALARAARRRWRAAAGSSLRRPRP